ncbi:MAG: DUF1501 domain-containing protein [Gemmataceae bacterium]|nr:DUF1501 domain-containing protein [Gemmataceae bacterium]MDW8267037.1 DUF1501 domain-containing protein [Gemmataceae bacterium]
MLNFESRRGVKFCDGLTRRDFLRVGALSAGAVGLTLADVMGSTPVRAAQAADINCILLFLVGGPSQLDTWDPKPDAPEHIRGPFRAIRTNVPGIELGEHFPLMAGMAHRFALVRSVYHQAAPIHETGHQMMQTGHLFRHGQEYPHYGAVVSHLRGPRASGLPPFVVLPGPIGNTGVSISHGQGAGFLGASHEPFVVEGSAAGISLRDSTNLAGLDPARLSERTALIEAVDAAQRAFEARGGPSTDTALGRAFGFLFGPNRKKAFDIGQETEALRARYGMNTFGQSCLLARRLIEQGVRFVTVNMFDTVFNQVTWDCHADGGSLATSLDDYRDILCPMFDQAYTALLEDLEQRGLLETTLVVAMGEFGRTPVLNPRGGRDHWPGVWTVLFAGGRVRGGQVIGASDALGGEPNDRPVTPAEIAATVYEGLGIDRHTPLPGPENRPVPIIEAAPIDELFGA